MRILYMSDIHIEFRERVPGEGWRIRPGPDTWPLSLGPDLSGPNLSGPDLSDPDLSDPNLSGPRSEAFAGDVDLLVLAGDIGPAVERRGVSAVRYAWQAADYLGCPAVLVPGNHEYYGAEFEGAREAMMEEAARKTEGPALHVLDRGEAGFEIGGGEGSGNRLRVLGVTLWTDYEAAGHREMAMTEARASMNDHRLIRNRSGGRWHPADALAEHRLSRAWLEERLEERFEERHSGGPTLIVTHHGPHPAARNPHYPIDALSGSFFSDLGPTIELARQAGTVAWIFGHDHHCHDVEVNGVRLLSAQPGYPNEGPERTGWRGPQMLEL